MATLTLNINKWLCGDFAGYREGAKTGINFFGNKEGVLLTENAPNSKEHSMCCIGQFLSQAGIDDKNLVGYGQPGDFSMNDAVKTDIDSANQEITEIFFTKTGNIINDTPLANDLMEINDNTTTTVFEKIKGIRTKLEEKGHELVIEDPKGELEQIKKQYIDEKLNY